MNNRLMVMLVAVAISGLLVFGCAGRKPNPDQYSGYLKDYSQLEPTKDIKGEPVLRFISPRLTKENYNKVIIEPVQYHPEPNPTENVSAGTLGEIKAYIDQTFRQKVAQKIEVVDTPGPGTARMRVALTAVGKESEALKPYQFVPVALVLTGARAATTGHPEEAALFLEAEMTDSVSGERLGIAVRRGTGERLKKARESGREVTLESIKPLLDQWSTAYTEFLYETIQAK